MTTIRIPGALRDFTGGHSTIEVDAADVAAALAQLAERHPALKRHLYNEHGALRSYVNVFVNDDEIRTLNGLTTPVAPTDG
ncbi:MAG TPA: MoaD/ThiS family protein, partial [Longimicrobiales bacterium]|nr:MoaD/ThiS family protein [Longimicrobiales bacterium]